jgi:hypothetical protein
MVVPTIKKKKKESECPLSSRAFLSARATLSSHRGPPAAGMRTRSKDTPSYSAPPVSAHQVGRSLKNAPSPSLIRSRWALSSRDALSRAILPSHSGANTDKKKKKITFPETQGRQAWRRFFPGIFQEKKAGMDAQSLFSPLQVSVVRALRRTEGVSCACIMSNMFFLNVERVAKKKKRSHTNRP